jgi:hypothetical protein
MVREMMKRIGSLFDIQRRIDALFERGLLTLGLPDGL